MADPSLKKATNTCYPRSFLLSLSHFSYNYESKIIDSELKEAINSANHCIFFGF